MSGAAFDLDAAAAVKREAAGLPFEFVWHDEKFSMPPAKLWPVRASSLLSDGDLFAALSLLLGDDAERFMAYDPTLADAEALMEAVAGWSGIGSLGE